MKVINYLLSLFTIRAIESVFIYYAGKYSIIVLHGLGFVAQLDPVAFAIWLLLINLILASKPMSIVVSKDDSKVRN